MVDFNLDVPIAKSIVEAISNAVDERKVSPEEVMEYKLKDKRIDAALAVGQMVIASEQAKHPSVFVAGARPAVMWICAAALAWNYVLYPLMSFLVWLFPEYRDVMETAPKLDTSELMTLLTGMLGFGGFRTFEKMRNVDTREIDGLPDILISGKPSK